MKCGVLWKLRLKAGHVPRRELGYKAAGDLIALFSDVITTALEKQHWSVTQIFKELKILMPARWVDEHH